MHKCVCVSDVKPTVEKHIRVHYIPNNGYLPGEGSDVGLLVGDGVGFLVGDLVG